MGQGPAHRARTAGSAEGGDRAPIPADLFARVYADYERAKARAGVIDFEDMLVETVDLLETDAEAAELVRARKTWFSVDEYQDTNPLAERLLELWLGDSRDLAVVGDPDQTIYTFTGATPEFLLGFEARHPGARVVALTENYRSTPQVLALANRLIAPGGRAARCRRRSWPRARADDPAPHRRRGRAARDRGRDPRAAGGGDRARRDRDPGPDQRPAARDRAGAHARRHPVPRARPAVLRAARGPRGAAAARRGSAGDDDTGATGAALVGAGFGRCSSSGSASGGDPDAGGDEARERQASLELLLSIVAGPRGRATRRLSVAGVIAELDRRDAEEASGSAAGVNLLTYHRAKGLEWDAVFLPALEEGLLPIRQAKEADAIDEERRLLYVGITRARRHLALSWAARRVGQAGKEGNRKPSRFLDALEGTQSRGSSRARRRGARGRAGATDRRARAARRRRLGHATRQSDGVLEALHDWRRDRARADAVPAYVVAHDAMLFAIAEARPQSLSALARISGMGPVKVERYGEDILAIMGRAG